MADPATENAALPPRISTNHHGHQCLRGSFYEEDERIRGAAFDAWLIVDSAAGYACSVAKDAPSVVLMDADRGGVTKKKKKKKIWFPCRGFTDRPQTARCSTLRGRPAGHPENQRRDPLGSAFRLSSRLREVSRRAYEARLLILFAYRQIKALAILFLRG
jgi:hypothetical protein